MICASTYFPWCIKDGEIKNNRFSISLKAIQIVRNLMDQKTALLWAVFCVRKSLTGQEWFLT
jgi:hypothetical protein